ncbi:MAG: helix-turn-helix domain-containing protein, partial [Bryobacteraceae bacterium]
AWAREAEERIAEAASDRARAAIVERMLRPAPPQPAGAIDHALARIEIAAAPGGVARLARETGMSERQLERAFADRVGISPKLLARIDRFQRALRAVEEAGVSGAAVAADLGYYDQAHLIRDFREFTGSTPSRLEMSDFYNTADAQSSTLTA